jgi:hypothetical protein
VTVRARLLGRPRVESGGTQPCPPPRGRKSWALLARVALSGRPPGRRELAGELFTEADDPLAALRWSLADLRRALGLPQLLRGDPLTLARGELWLDVWALEDGALPPQEIGGELLDGVDLRDSPGFDTWLLLARSRCAAHGRSCAGTPCGCSRRVTPRRHSRRRRTPPTSTRSMSRPRSCCSGSSSPPAGRGRRQRTWPRARARSRGRGWSCRLPCAPPPRAASPGHRGESGPGRSRRLCCARAQRHSTPAPRTAAWRRCAAPPRTPRHGPARVPRLGPGPPGRGRRPARGRARLGGGAGDRQPGPARPDHRAGRTRRLTTCHGSDPCRGRGYGLMALFHPRWRCEVGGSAVGQRRRCASSRGPGGPHDDQHEDHGQCHATCGLPAG